MTSLHAIPFPNISPVFFELGPLQFRWYGLMYLIGLAGAYFLIMRRVESRGLSMTKDQVYNMVVWAAFGGLSEDGSVIRSSIIFPTTSSTLPVSWQSGKGACPSTVVCLVSSSPYFGLANGRVSPPTRSQTWRLPPHRSG